MRVFERHGWILLFGAATVLFLLSIFVMIDPVGGDPDFAPIAGITWDEFADESPGAAAYIEFVGRSIGSVTLAFSLLSMAVIWKSYRNHEKWAWYALWTLPMLFGLGLALVVGAGGASWPLWGVFLVVAILGLLFPGRSFFRIEKVGP